MAESGPVFVLACGWRSGSTLVQRILCSHPHIHIWGENGGISDQLAALLQLAQARSHLSQQGTTEFAASGTDGWIANWCPPPQDLAEGIACLLTTYLAAPAQQMGKRRWGFKEVRHGLGTATFLRAIFPASQFIILVRNPAHCLASARGTQVVGRTRGLLHEVGGPQAFLEHWTTLAASFAVSDGLPHLLVRYEDLVTDTTGTLGRIARHIGVDEGDFRTDVLGVRRRGWEEARPRLVDDDISSLESRRLWRIAAYFGYLPGTWRSGPFSQD